MITVILVNYHQADLIVDAVHSALAQADAEGLDIWLVDNSECDRQEQQLRENLPAPVHYVRNPRNTGFAAACNLAYSKSAGEAVLLLNPDARLLPGALARLRQTLFSAADIGAVGPLVYWDEGRQFLLPPSTFPSMGDYWSRAAARLHPRLTRKRSMDFRKKAMQLWSSRRPVRVDALSGGHVLLKRQAIEDCGGLFDEKFFMYWEDSDLMARLQQSGYRLLVDTEAACIHCYEHGPSKDALLMQGWGPYYDKHFRGRLLTRLADRLSRYGRDLDDRISTQIVPVPGQVMRLPVPEALRDGWLLEISPCRDFVPAIGCFGTGAWADIPSECWRRLKGRDYYCRLAAPVGAPPQPAHWHWHAPDE